MLHRCATLIALLLLTACSGSGEGGVWSIKRGMSMEQVRDALGPPERTLHDINGPDPGGHGPWWLYPARKENTNISWIYFGFDKSSQVRTIAYGHHLLSTARSRARRSHAAVVVVIGFAVVSGGCMFGVDGNRTTQQRVPSVIDETVGAYGGIKIGSSEADVRRVFGKPGEGQGFFPLGETFGEIGGAPGVRNWPPSFREAPTVLRYERVAFLVGPRGVFAFVVTADRAATKRGVRIGDPLARAQRVYGAGCGEQPYGEAFFGETPSFRWCRTTISDRIRLWFGRDPIRSITLARVGAA